MEKKLSIRLYGKELGILEQDKEGKMSFTYDQNADAPISIAMPVRTQPYNDAQCEAFFGGLLPESMNAKKQIAQRFRISEHNTLLQIQPNQFGLAPFYDIVCTRVYPDLSTKMAMKIGSKYDINQILPRHWEQFCNEIHYSFPALKKLIKSKGESLSDILDLKKEYFNTSTNNAKIINKIIASTQYQVEKIVNQFEK